MIKNDCSAWANVRGTGFDQNNAISTYEEQINVTGDIGRKLSSDLRVALLAACLCVTAETGWNCCASFFPMRKLSPYS
jgi:hypothetical protein